MSEERDESKAAEASIPEPSPPSKELLPPRRTEWRTEVREPPPPVWRIPTAPPAV